MTQDQQLFCINNGITEDEFFGRKVIKRDLDWNHLTSIPEGFNPMVRGSLILDGLLSIPDGFNPIVSGTMNLNRVAYLPDGFSPVIGTLLRLGGLLSIPDDIKSKVVVGWQIMFPPLSTSLGLNNENKSQFTAVLNAMQSLNCHNVMEQGVIRTRGKNKYIVANAILTEVINQTGNTYMVKGVSSDHIFYLVFGGNGLCAHGETIDGAGEMLRFLELDFKYRHKYQLSDDKSTQNELFVQHNHAMILETCQEGIRQLRNENGVAMALDADGLIQAFYKTGKYFKEKVFSLLRSQVPNN